jgi:serine/threonine protein phosphatase PrpC
MRWSRYVANVGDSNAVLSRMDGSAQCLTVEHKPDAAVRRSLPPSLT